ncbi:MAG: Endonuclease [Rhodospirillales bacterium]|nr:Endonuclease [Rhodospirillales bacterium]
MPPALRNLAPRIRLLETRTAKPPVKVALPFYLVPEWRALMNRLIEKRGRRCEAKGCGRTNCRIFGDHIVELQDGGALFDESNVQLLCGSHHTAKTAASRAARLAKRHVCDGEERPIDP